MNHVFKSKHGHTKYYSYTYVTYHYNPSDVYNEKQEQNDNNNNNSWVHQQVKIGANQFVAKVVPFDNETASLSEQKQCSLLFHWPLYIS